jgi:hypothetical protein
MSSESNIIDEIPVPPPATEETQEIAVTTEEAKVEAEVQAEQKVEEQKVEEVKAEDAASESSNLDKLIDKIQADYQEQLNSIVNIYEVVLIVIQVVEQEYKQDKKSVAVQILSKLKLNEAIKSEVDAVIASGMIDQIIESLVKVASNSQIHSLFTKSKQQLISTAPKSCCTIQ